MNLKKASLKQKLVLIIGIAYYVVILCRHIETLLYHAPRPYVISTFIQYTAMITAMHLVTFKSGIIPCLRQPGKK